MGKHRGQQLAELWPLILRDWATALTLRTQQAGVELSGLEAAAVAVGVGSKIAELHVSGARTRGDPVPTNKRLQAVFAAVIDADFPAKDDPLRMDGDDDA